MSRARRIALLLIVGIAGWAPVAAEDPLEARPFEVHFRPLVDVAELIDPLLSDEGRIILRPRLKTLIVEDRRSVLDRVRMLVEDYDLPPGNVELTFSLFLGRREDGVPSPHANYGLSEDVRGVLDQLSDFTKWTTYEPLGSRSVTGTEGDRVEVDLSDEFRVVFTIESIHKTHGAVKFESLQLQRVEVLEQGAENVKDLYRASLVLPPGELYMVGAAADPNSKRALFLALKTQAR